MIKYQRNRSCNDGFITAIKIVLFRMLDHRDLYLKWLSFAFTCIVGYIYIYDKFNKFIFVHTLMLHKHTYICVCKQNLMNSVNLYEHLLQFLSIIVSLCIVFCLRKRQ